MTDQAQDNQNNPHLLRDLLLLTLVFGALFFSFLGNRPLAAPDEGRYTEIPREMAESGDYITPRLNGLKYFEKPPLLYWVQTAPIKLFGVKEWAMRLPLAILALLGCLMTYFFTQRLYSRQVGLWAAGILGSSLLYNVLARILILDMGVSIFLSGTLFSFVTATEEERPLKRRLWMYLAASFAAAAVLSKGLIGLALPGLIAVIWLTLTKRWALLKWLYLPSSIGVFFLLAAPWHILASLKNPGFFDFYFIHEHFERYLTTVHRRHQPIWFFIPVTLLGLLPWPSFLINTLRVFVPKTLFGQRSPKAFFFFLWATIPFIFFSISNSKLIPYILPIFPAIAVMMAFTIVEHLKNNHSFKLEIFGHSALCLILIGGLTFALMTKLDPDLKVLLRTHLIILYSVLGFSAAFLPILRLWKGPRPALFGILLSGIAIVMVIVQASPLVPRLSIKPLAERFLKYMPEDTQVFTYIGYYQDLPPYLGRTVQVVHWHGELKFGTEAEPEQTQVVDYEYFNKAWKSSRSVCAFMRQDRYNNLIAHAWFTPTILGEHDGQVLACNRVPKDVLAKVSSLKN